MPQSVSATGSPFGTGTAHSAFAADCLAGLSCPRKRLPCKWLYDDAGSRLFERITTLAAYYPSRMEEALLEPAAAHVASAIAPRTLVELGSGASRKTRALLAAAPTIRTYVAIDISADELDRARASLHGAFPELTIVAICADFTAALALDRSRWRPPTLLFFPGSTLGNLTPAQAVDFLAELRVGAEAGTRLLLGVDLLKDEDTLRAAYDDPEGVTAAFNLNLLSRMRRELGAEVDSAGFRHLAVWNHAERRVEMHLVAVSRQQIRLLGRRFVVERGETIHTENSYKLSLSAWRSAFERAGWQVEMEWRSPAPEFLLALLTTGAA